MSVKNRPAVQPGSALSWQLCVVPLQDSRARDVQFEPVVPPGAGLECSTGHRTLRGMERALNGGVSSPLACPARRAAKLLPFTVDRWFSEVSAHQAARTTAAPHGCFVGSRRAKRAAHCRVAIK